jgi:ornithine carbamoyltransferase
MAEYSAVPVINALTDGYHPCQVLADCQTLIEHKGKLDGLKIVFVGDGNNMVHSWIEAAAIVPFSFALACPRYEPDAAILNAALSNGAKITVINSVEAAVGGGCVYTDVWTSTDRKKNASASMPSTHQVNSQVVAMAKKDAVG